MSTNGIAVAMSRPSDQPEAVPTLSEPQIAARIERLPASQWHLMIIALVGTATLFDCYDIAVIAFVMPVLVDTWKLAPNQVDLIFSAGFAGLAIGAFVFGWLAERYGRVPILIVTILLLSVGGIGCALSDGYFTLLTFRFLQGLVAWR
jgi:MFS transporter, putative metabolite:H+ symporter